MLIYAFNHYGSAIVGSVADDSSGRKLSVSTHGVQIACRR
jgi:hypothetical protein